MRLSRDFILSELTVTNVSAVNSPNEAETEKLLYLCQFILQPIRNKWGPLTVTSGFRSEEVNNAVGGARYSQHRLGEACDFVPDNERFQEVFEWCKRYLTFGQLILENKGGVEWIHISLPRIGGINNQSMTFQDGKYTVVT